ncbi:hypothetical protein shim_28950 [Shimia sp. SK013]|uniref:hypothetical protein n=1 Tax=Shimia sp. SK013 TaxID=1389006 RepID=UPI0006B5AE45|nr:hypothetical protein [Shimia sp. SK013]KPA20979.1 hypothetical protein shim_28950 [Shimia sp. SK013]
MSTIIILSILGLGAAALLGGAVGGDDIDIDAADDATEADEAEQNLTGSLPLPADPQDSNVPDDDIYDGSALPDAGDVDQGSGDYEHVPDHDDTEEDPADGGYDRVTGTEGDDTLLLHPNSDNPILAIGGDGADTFVAEYPHRDGDSRPFDVIISDFDDTEDVLTLEVVSDAPGTSTETPQDFTLEPADDGSYVDVRVTVFDPDTGPESARDFVVRLDGISTVNPDSIYLADANASHEDDEAPGDTEPAPNDSTTEMVQGDVGDLDLRGTRGDDTIIIDHDSGSVVVNGGAGDDTIDARSVEIDEDTRLRIDGSEGDDTYLFAQGINVSDDQFGGADVYSMTVDPDQMQNSNPSTVVWDFEDRFQLTLPADLADSVRIENLPPRYDASLGSVVQRDDVYVGDTLVMKLINLDEENRITLDSGKFEILPIATAA